MRCPGCGKDTPYIARILGYCADCIRGDFETVRLRVAAAHAKARRPFRLPEAAPQAEGGAPCVLCANECRIGLGEQGYCGLRENRGGRLRGATADAANVSWYYDPLPTNCVADWVCPGGSGAGFPKFAHRPGAELGDRNLAVFYQACSFDCLFCQNWHHRHRALDGAPISAARLAQAADRTTSCICYFGGDPSPQMPHSLRVARLARARRRGEILRICWETNGSMHPALLRQAMSMALESGGCIKFDLKAWDEGLHMALTGISNRRTLENFRLAAGYIRERPVPPPLVASTLLVPAYVDEAEVSAIARFIASLDADIPYSLLAFYPTFCMPDLPTTSRREAEACHQAARAAGLTRVRIGNPHLLWD